MCCEDLVVGPCPGLLTEPEQAQAHGGAPGGLAREPVEHRVNRGCTLPIDVGHRVAFRGCTVDLWDWAVRFLPTVLAANQQGMDGVRTHGVLQQLTLALPPPSDGEGILGMLLCLCVASLHQRME